VNKRWFIGYKLHEIIYDNGVVQQSGITKANVHDISYLKEGEHLPKGKLLLENRAYVSMPLQMELFQDFKAKGAFQVQLAPL
jgi:hypothetical protein